MQDKTLPTVILAHKEGGGTGVQWERQCGNSYTVHTLPGTPLNGRWFSLPGHQNIHEDAEYEACLHPSHLHVLC